MTTVPCPGCSAPLELAQEVCPSCRRPRNADEIELGRREAAASYERRKALPLKLLGYATLLAAVAALYVNRTSLLAHAGRLRAGFDAELEKASDPAGLSPRPTETAVAAMEQARAEAAATPTATPAAPAATPAASPLPAAAALAEPPPTPDAPPNNMRRFYGVVYDLATLRPVARASVRISHKRGAALTTAITSPAGHYSVDVYLDDLERGVVMSASAVGYREGQLEESGAPYRERPLDSREKTAEETADADLSALLLPGGDSRAVPLDLVLLPSKP